MCWGCASEACWCAGGVLVRCAGVLGGVLVRCASEVCW